MSPLRNAVLGGLLLALACSSTDPPKSSLGSPGQHAGSMAAPPDAAPVATTGSKNVPGALPGDSSTARDSGTVPAAEAVEGATSAGQDAAVAVAAPEPAPQSRTRGASKDTPRDLQVLPGAWSRERVEKYMKSEIERGLGVDCAYCHDKDDYAKDHARKSVARRMMRMTTDLNRQYFKGQSKVTCYSCHKGKKKP